MSIIPQPTHRVTFVAGPPLNRTIYVRLVTALSLTDAVIIARKMAEAFGLQNFRSIAVRRITF